MAKKKVWHGTMSIRHSDGTVAQIAEVEDINGVLGEPKVQWLMAEEEREECARRMLERAAQVAADFTTDGKPSLPDGQYKIMDLLRGG